MRQLSPSHNELTTTSANLNIEIRTVSPAKQSAKSFANSCKSLHRKSWQDAVIFVYHYGLSPLNSPLSNIFTLVALLPSLAVATRRLHDVDRTGWWMLLVFTGIGIAVLLYWQSQEGTPDRNRFGPNPATAEHLRTRQAL